MKGLSLFSGIGGLDLAFEWAGGMVAAMCEIEPYCRKVLQKHWPDVPVFEDVRRLRAEDVGAVDVIYGGFPCQPFSVAGNQKGRDDDRYLWPEFSRLVGELKPRWVVGENVPGILHLAADDVCQDLERQGYKVGIWDYEAAAVGTPHRRERFFFVAHANSERLYNPDEPRNLQMQKAKGTAAQLERPSSTPIANSDSAGREKPQQPVPAPAKYSTANDICGWGAEPGVGRVAHGVPHRVDRLRGLGNAVVPQQTYPVFKAIMEVGT